MEMIKCIFESNCLGAFSQEKASPKPKFSNHSHLIFPSFPQTVDHRYKLISLTNNYVDTYLNQEVYYLTIPYVIK